MIQYTKRNIKIEFGHFYYCLGDEILPTNLIKKTLFTKYPNITINSTSNGSIYSPLCFICPTKLSSRVCADV